MAEDVKQQDKQDSAGQKDVSRLQDVFVTAVIALIGAAVAFGLYSQAGFTVVPSLAIGSGLFIWLLSAHFLITRMRFKRLIDNKLGDLASDVVTLKKELEVTDLLAEGHNDLMSGQETLEKSAKVLVERLDAQDVKLKILHKMTKAKMEGPVKKQLSEQKAKVDELTQDFQQLSDAFHGFKEHYARIEVGQVESSRQSRVLMKAQLDILELVVRELGEASGKGQVPLVQKTLQAIGGLRRMPVLNKRPVSLNKPDSAMDDEGFSSSPPLNTNTSKSTARVASEATLALDAPQDGEAELTLNGEVGDEQMLALVNDAIQNNLFELFLQPIVDLPDRELRYYEAFSKFRLKVGGVVDHLKFMPVAEDAELAPIIDNQTILQTIQVVQRLIERGKGRVIFCNISLASLKDADFFAEFLDFMETNQWLNQHLVFEFSHEAIENAGAFEFDRIDAIAKLGFKFSLDELNSFELDFARLAEHSFAFVKVNAALFLGDMVGARAQIHVADLSHYLNRLNMRLIVDGVNRDAVVRQLRDNNVYFAQGDLFCEPKPVRPEVFENRDEAAA